MRQAAGAVEPGDEGEPGPTGAMVRHLHGLADDHRDLPTEHDTAARAGRLRALISHGEQVAQARHDAEQRDLDRCHAATLRAAERRLELLDMQVAIAEAEGRLAGLSGPAAPPRFPREQHGPTEPVTGGHRPPPAPPGGARGPFVDPHRTVPIPPVEPTGDQRRRLGNDELRAELVERLRVRLDAGQRDDLTVSGLLDLYVAGTDRMTARLAEAREQVARERATGSG